MSLVKRSIDVEIVVKIEQFFSDYSIVKQDAIETVRDIMDPLILAVVQNINSLTFTRDIGRGSRRRWVLL